MKRKFLVKPDICANRAQICQVCEKKVKLNAKIIRILGQSTCMHVDCLDDFIAAINVAKNSDFDLISKQYNIASDHRDRSRLVARRLRDEIKREVITSTKFIRVKTFSPRTNISSSSKICASLEIGYSRSCNVPYAKIWVLTDAIGNIAIWDVSAIRSMIDSYISCDEFHEYYSKHNSSYKYSTYSYQAWDALRASSFVGGAANQIDLRRCTPTMINKAIEHGMNAIFIPGADPNGMKRAIKIINGILKPNTKSKERKNTNVVT